ncbi:Protein of unknown function [Sphingobium sp. AP50]|uniref:DUF3325 domain-containing protein n=1 Tax=Sphingobium sp. AP50 TaxID=1884369 RepID=UPI0008C8C4FA|nr:DUF3325 domain-containing protein [Sphingobium sp. AP50]SEJ00125.1 Protein of unknown function [Sphingobium sp. AP50]
MSLETGLIGYAALASLALAVKKYRPSPPLPMLPSPSVARWSGWMLLGLAAIVAVLRFGAGLGVVAWIGQLCISGAALVLLMSWRPRLAYGLAVPVAAIGLLLTAT